MLLSVEEHIVYRMIAQEKPVLQGAAGLEELLERSGWMPLRATGWISVTGEDRVRWLNGMVTNSVQALQPGEGAYCFLLNAQGRIQGDGTVWCEADRLLIETDRAQVQSMIELLDRFIIMDDVLLADETEAVHGLEIAGLDAAKLLDALGLQPAGEQLRRVGVQWRNTKLDVITGDSPLVPRFELWANSAEVLAELATLFSQDAAEVTPESFELLRILEARPAFGRDIRDRDLPQEVAQTRALHFQKGCYLGQEIVERIRSRGQVHRTFTAFVLHGALPAAGTQIFADGKAMGVLTSIASAAVRGEQLALGYLRRDALERGTALQYTTGAEAETGTAEARTGHAASKT